MWRMDDARLSISVFGRRSRLSMKALRLYDRLGLLTPAEVDERSGYRWYREGQLETARLIAMLRRLDMPLTVVGEVVSAPAAKAAELIDEFWAATERRVASQRELAAHLRLVLSGGEGMVAMYEVQQRDVDEQLVLTEQRHVTVAELSPWIGQAMTRLASTAERFGGVAGNEFVVYHGQIDEDNDGPAECCVPIDPARRADAVAPMRSEPAHREAYVRLTRAQVEFPQILSAYDTVERWITEQGHTATGAPREVYFADYMTAKPSDEICDVAFPIG
jgi:DNA-binding transcriptional MerR regulator